MENQIIIINHNELQQQVVNSLEKKFFRRIPTGNKSLLMR